MERRLKTPSRGFTLIELMLVITIMCLLAAILIPVLNEAKKSAKVETSKHYLRQQYLALELYSQSADGEFPIWSVAKTDQMLRVPCSPMDHWRTPCWSRDVPMLGSYGYIKGIDQRVGRDSAQLFPLLADVFSAHYRLGEFSGLRFPDYLNCIRQFTCEYPDRIWFVYSDGSLQVQKHAMPSPERMTARELFTWEGVFDRQINLIRD